MAKQLVKGNEAVVTAAVLAGCRSFYGYPITPASEITEAAAALFPRAGGTFLQAESEVAAINMVFGAASAGERTMTASSGPGLSLMQEGLSYLAGAGLPCVVVDITRGGPGLGNIAPEQSDYHHARRSRSSRPRWCRPASSSTTRPSSTWRHRVRMSRSSRFP
jgi:2-oxoisovalerate ferredoxin oxidoreductase alpha subunit